MFFNSRTLGFLMGCDEDDKLDEEIWDGDVLTHQFDSFDDDPYADLRDLLTKNIQISQSSLSSAGPATSTISIVPVIAKEHKNSDMTLKDEGSDLVEEVSEPEKPPDIDNFSPNVLETCATGSGGTSDTLANIVESLGIAESVELVSGSVSDLDVTEAGLQAENVRDMAAEVTTESQQCENIYPEEVTTDSQQCENISPGGGEGSLWPEAISDDDGEVAENSSKLLDYMSICENTILVYRSDFLTLRPNAYVSDPIVNFYLDYLHRRKVSPTLQKDVYIFPSWFYQMLSSTRTVMKPPVNVFDKGCKI